MELHADTIHISVSLFCHDHCHGEDEGAECAAPDAADEPGPGEPMVAGSVAEAGAPRQRFRLLNTFRRQLAEAARRQGATEEQLAVITGLGDGALLELLLKYGPDLVKILKVLLGLLA